MVGKVLIVTNRSDAHADYCSTILGREAIPFVRFNTELFPSEIAVSCSFQDTGEAVYRFASQRGGVLFDSPEVGCVWYRRVPPAGFTNLEREAHRAFAETERRALLVNLWYALERQAFWVHHPTVLRRAENKLLQLAVARRVGLTVPDTLVTNDREEAIRFFERHARRGVVYKTIESPMLPDEGDPRCVYTSPVSSSDEVLDALETTPCLLQEYIEKAYELRITIAGERVFAAKIYSQEYEDTRVDWRRGQMRHPLRHEACTLDQNLGNLCLRLLQDLGLVFGAIDMAVTPRGEYVFLEINPNGQWLWIEHCTGLPIGEAIVGLFAQHLRRNRPSVVLPT